MNPLDAIAVILLGAAALRGLKNGLAREVSSLAALAATCIAVRMFVGPAGKRIESMSALSPLDSKIIAGVLIAIATLAAVVLVGRLLSGGLRAAGLGFFDRIAGGVLGTAEGAVVVAVLMLLAFWVLGREDPRLADSRTAAAFEQFEDWAAQNRGRLPDVAAPPRR